MNRKKIKTFFEIVQSIRKPAAPPSRCHGDARKERSRKECRNKRREED